MVIDSLLEQFMLSEFWVSKDCTGEIELLHGESDCPYDIGSFDSVGEAVEHWHTLINSEHLCENCESWQEGPSRTVYEPCEIRECMPDGSVRTSHVFRAKTISRPGCERNIKTRHEKYCTYFEKRAEMSQ